MPEPLISIIIPAYNEERRLSLCLQSVAACDFDHSKVEIIVIDNGSTDRTGEIAREHGAKVIENTSKKVAGLRNLGVTRSSGAILAFLDADCTVSADWLKNAIAYSDRREIACWGSPPTPPDPATWVQSTWFLIRKKEKGLQSVDWLESMNLFVRRETFSALKGFNESLETCEDVDFCYRARNYGSIVSDSGIKVTHLGEAATVRAFFKKELWRGCANLQGLRSHGIILRELPSLAIPLYFGFFIPLGFVIALFSGSGGWVRIMICFLILPTVVALLKLRKKIRPADILPVSALIQLYYIARAISIFKGGRARG